jgi:hypothetical protein
MPLTRALEKFAGGLAAVGRGMDKGPGGGVGSALGGIATPAINQDWGGVFKNISAHLEAASKKYMSKAATLAGGSSTPGGSSITKATGAAAIALGKFSGITSKSSGAAALAIGKFAGIAALAAKALTKFNVVTGTASAVIAAGKMIPGVGAVAKVGEAGFGMMGKRLTSDLAALSLPLAKFTTKAETLAVGLEEAGKASHAYSSAISSSTATMAGAAQGFMKSFGEALSNPTAGLPALVGAVRPFVEAFNPYALQQFDDALRTVYAVIGEALVPIVKMAAGVLREFAGYLRPVMKQLEPIFAELAQMAGGFLKDLMPELAKFAAELAPIFRQYLEQMKESIGGQKEMMIAGLKYATGQMSLLGVLGVGIKSWLSKLPLIGRFFKADKEKSDEELKAAKQLVPKENIFSFGAPTNPTFKGVESLGRDTLQSAYAAMPGMEKKNEELDAMKQIADNTAQTVSALGQVANILSGKEAGKFANDTVRAATSVQEGAKVYDERVKAGGIVGGAQKAAGQVAEGVYNFGVGVSNLFSGRKLNEGMVDI